MKKWEVCISSPAETDLDGIYSYIATSLLEPETASHQVERIRKAILSLDEMPERGALLPDEPWHTRGLRHLLVDQYAIIYETQESSDSVTVIAVLHTKRNSGDVMAQGGR